MTFLSRAKSILFIVMAVIVVGLFYQKIEASSRLQKVKQLFQSKQTVYHEQTPTEINVSVEPEDFMYEIPNTGEKKRMKVHELEPGYLVPNVMHYTWYDNRPNRMNFRYHHMISMLSAYKYNKPDALYLWYETKPRGPIWARTLKLIPNIRLVHRPGPTSIYGNKVNVQEHKSDIVRLEAVLKYGGIYTDLDVVVLKSMNPLRKFATTMGLEEPHMLCNGIIISAPRAYFLEIWHYHYKTFKDSQWAHHSVIVPARLAKKHPKLIHIEERSLHRPNWRKQERKLMYDNGSNYDYSKNYAVHLYYRWHNIEHNDNDIKTINSTMGKIFRQIMYDSPNMIKN